MEPSLNTWTILFLVSAIQGLFLGVMILMRKSRVNNLLGFLVLSFSILLLFYVTYWTRYLQLLPAYFGVLQGLTYTFGPLTYFYIRSSRKDFYFNILHFIPFAAYVIYSLNWNNYSEQLRPVIMQTQVVAQNAHLLIYTILIFQFISKNKGVYNGALKLYQWRKNVALAFSGYTLSFITYFAMVYTGTLKIEYDYMISLASSFFIYFIGYQGFQKPETFRMYESGKYDRSSLPSSAGEPILNRIKEFMSLEKPYLDSNLKLQDIADQLQLSTHYVSQVINEMEGKNLADFINEYRIDAAKEMLEKTSEKIIHIAYDCGFNNKTSFSNAFKKFVGMSPSEYRQKQALLSA